MSTVVFTRAATATEMTGGTASRPIVCRANAGRITSGLPSALPAIDDSACAIFAGVSSGPALLPIAIQLAMPRMPGRFPPETMISRSFTWLMRELSLSKVVPQPLLDTSILLRRTILAVTTTCSFGRLLNEPEVVLLPNLVVRGIRKPSRRLPQLRSRPTTRTMLWLALLGIRLVRAVLKRKQLRMLLFARPNRTSFVCLEQLLSMTIPSRKPPPREEIPLRISPNFARGEYHSFDLFDRIDVAVVGDANAHTR